MIIPDIPRRTSRDLPGGDWLWVERIDGHLPARGWPRHELFALILVCRGEGSYQDAAGERFRLQAGSAFLHLPTVTHRILRHDRENWVQLVIRCNAGLWEALSCFADPPPMPPVWPAPPLMAERIAALREDLICPALGGWDLLARLAACLGACWPAAEDPWQHIARSLGADHRDRLSLEACAEELGLSYSHFRRSFRQRFDQAPAAWRRQHRLAEARRLLAAGQTLPQVAKICAWSQSATLKRVLKGGSVP
jgi:AraC-like DNA-binding protein